MSDNTFPTPISKDEDLNALSNPVYVSLVDSGGDQIEIDASGNLNVILAANDGVDIGDVDVTSVVPGTGATNLGKAEDAVAGDGDTGVMLLAVRRDADAATAADGDYHELQVDENGFLKVVNAAQFAYNDDSAFTIGSDKVAAVGYIVDESGSGSPDSVDEGDIGAARMTADRKQLVVLADATTDGNRLSITASGSAKVDIAEQSLTAVAVSKDNSANAETNPIFVQVVSSALSGNEIHDEDEGVDIAQDTEDNHDYTVAGTTFLLKSVLFAASGGMKVEVETGPLASLVRKGVAFIPRHGGFGQIVFDPPVEVPATGTGTVRVTRTNRQNQSQSLYSTIIGNDVA